MNIFDEITVLYKMKVNRREDSMKTDNLVDQVVIQLLKLTGK